MRSICANPPGRTAADESDQSSSVGGFLAAGFLIWHLPSTLNAHANSQIGTGSRRIAQLNAHSVRVGCNLPQDQISSRMVQGGTLYPEKPMFLTSYIVLCSPARVN